MAFTTKIQNAVCTAEGLSSSVSIGVLVVLHTAVRITCLCSETFGIGQPLSQIIVTNKVVSIVTNKSYGESALVVR